MERSILMDAKNHKVSTPNSNLISSPLIMIDSISIDLVNENEKIETGNCQHFSIRGYVADMRKKDKKQCWPFSVDDKQNKTEECISTLPPLQTSKFRWWRCENCRRETDPQSAANEIVTNPICNGNGHGVNSCTDKREKDDQVAQNTCIRHVNSSKDDANQKISRGESVAEKIDLCLKPESCKVPLELKCNVETGKSDCRINEASANELSTTKLDCQVKKQNTVSNGDASAPASLGSDKQNSGPSVNDEALAVNDLIDDFDEDPFVSHRQKPRKIRLLSDLLEASGGNAKANHNTQHSLSYSDSQSPRGDKVLNIGKEFNDKSKKRKMGHDGHGKLPETSPFNSENRKGKISLSGSKSNYKEVDRNHRLDEKVMETGDGDDQNNFLNKQKQDAGNAGIATSHQISMGRVTEPVLQNLFPVLGNKTKSSLCKKKNRRPQVENFQTVLMPWNQELLRKNSIIRQNTKTMQTRPEVQAPIFSYEDFLATQQSKRNFIPIHIERRPDFVLPKTNDVGSKHISESSVPYKSIECAFHDKAVQRETGPGVKSIVSNKQIRPSRVEDQDLPISQRMDASGKINSEECIKLNTQGGQGVDNLFDQRTTDDIPMDIVELLAKNQYERRLQSAEKIPSPFQTTNKPKNGMKVTVNNVRVNGEIKSSQIEEAQSGKLQPDNVARKNVTAIDEIVLCTTQKPVSNFPHMSLQDGSYMSKGLHAFSTGVQSAATSSSKQVDAHTSYWSSLLRNHFSYKDQAHPPLQNGKMSGNPVPKPFDLNVASTEKQNPNFGSQSTVNKINGFSNGMGLSPNFFGSKGLYSNDTIPAMHLLSLIDPGMRSITPFNAHENTKFLKAPLPLPQDRHLSSSVDYRKNPIPENSCDCAFTSSLRNDILTLKSHGKGKAKRPESPKRSKMLKSQTTTNSGLPTIFECNHGKIPQRLMISDANLQSSREIGDPIKKNPNLEICVVNRNPADFTMLGSGNIYMIGPEQLKFSHECELTSADRHKKPRPPKLTSTKKTVT